ncbi:unnamed protein product, partial [Cyprideis torosa]
SFSDLRHLLCLSLQVSSASVSPGGAAPSSTLRPPFVETLRDLPQSCTFRGRCDSVDTTLGVSNVPCVYQEAPQHLPESSVDILREVCGDILPGLGPGENGTFCCASTQVNDLKSNLILPASFLQGCPACYKNF